MANDMIRTSFAKFLCAFAPLYAITAIILQHVEILKQHHRARFMGDLLNITAADEILWMHDVDTRNEKGATTTQPSINKDISIRWRSQDLPSLEDVEALVNQTTLDIPADAYRTETSPVRDLLKVYVYDSLPPNLSTELEEFIETVGHKYNWITDLVLVRLFQTFPGRTYDPADADIFVVPYLHIAHCMKAGYMIECRSLNEKTTSTELFQHLSFYNASTAHRHLFFLSESEFMSHRWLLRQPLVTFYGPRWDHIGKRSKTLSPPGHILIPQYNARPDFQPSVVLATQQAQQTRDLSLVFAAPYLNRNMGGGGVKSPRIFRKFLLESLAAINHTTIGGLPFIASDDIQQYTNNSAHKDGLYGLYRRAIFCPILAGDITWQRRFFDVMACGCLPVVMSYKLSLPHTQKDNMSGIQKDMQNNWTEHHSWFVPEHAFEIGDTWSVRESYPYLEHIDYRGFTVEVEGNLTVHDDLSHVAHTLEELSKSALHQKQVAMSKAAVSFLYGVGPDAHRYEDAFAHLIRSLRTYLDDL
jgi:hypothetical protein